MALYYFIFLYMFHRIVVSQDLVTDDILSYRAGKDREIHCRDDWNNPVDWWYLYKPAPTEGLESGTNYSYILPQTAGRWLPSEKNINIDSMLQYTMAPLYSHREDLGIVVYTHAKPGKKFSGSNSMGVLMAHKFGGLWIFHSIPDFPDLEADKATISKQETARGHVITCMTEHLTRLNELGTLVYYSKALIQKMHMPIHIKKMLPTWSKLQGLNASQYRNSAPMELKYKSFRTRDDSLRGVIIARAPGDDTCIYKAFAYSKKVVLDVYGDTEHRDVKICEPNYSLRRINSISLNHPDQVVYYLNNKTDAMSFAVTTGAQWQRRSKAQTHFKYWVCVGNVESQIEAGMGGILLCAIDYAVWLSFDNFKVKEPDCHQL